MKNLSSCVVGSFAFLLFASLANAQIKENSVIPSKPVNTKVKGVKTLQSEVQKATPNSKEKRADLSHPRAVDRSVDNRAARLGTWIEALADDAKRNRVWSGVVACLGGVLSTTIGAGIGLSDQRERAFDSSSNAAAVFLSGAYILSGTVLTAYGAYVLYSPSFEEDRWQRWQKTSRKPMDSATLLRFEGELRTDAIRARGERLTAGMLDLGLALGGVATVSIATYAARNYGEYSFAYLFGGLMTALGSISAIVRFMTESDAEKAWRRYRSGLSYEDEEEVELTVQPVSLNGGAGLLLSGAF
jgi:hypothetical protein